MGQVVQGAAKIAITSATLGFVSVNDNGISLHDPITGVVKISQEIAQSVVNDDENKGVWLGTKPLYDDFPLRAEGIILNQANWKIAHAAVLINGDLWSYEGKSGISCTSSVKLQRASNKMFYTWKFKGWCKQSKKQIQNFVDIFNCFNTYHAIKNNCQDAADKLIYFATNY